MKGATITVKGTNANEWYDQVFTASCADGHASCEADPGKRCEDSDTTSSAAEGQCNMESDGEGSATCSSTGGEDPTAGCPTSDPVGCTCPDWLCDAGGIIPGDVVPDDLVPDDPLPGEPPCRKELEIVILQQRTSMVLAPDLREMIGDPFAICK